MKRLLEKSPVKGYQLFRHQGVKKDGTPVIYPNYYIRYAGRSVCTGTDQIEVAKTILRVAKKMADAKRDELVRRQVDKALAAFAEGSE